MENRYFTLMFVNVGTVTVLDSRREVSVSVRAEMGNKRHAQKKSRHRSYHVAGRGHAKNGKEKVKSSKHVID